MRLKRGLQRSIFCLTQQPIVEAGQGSEGSLLFEIVDLSISLWYPQLCSLAVGDAHLFRMSCGESSSIDATIKVVKLFPDARGQGPENLARDGRGEAQVISGGTGPDR